MFFLSLFLSCSGETKESDSSIDTPVDTAEVTDTAEVIDTGEVTDTATTEEECPVSMNLLSGETLEPSVIRLFFTLRDCNDYGITGKTAEDFVISEDGSEISIFESSQQLIPSTLGYDIKTLLLLDMSGSIVSSGNLPNLQESASNFVTSVSGTQSVGIYGFDGAQNIYELIPFTDDSQVLLDGIAGLSNYEVQDNSTNLNGGVIKALERLEQEEQNSTSSYFQGTLIVFTDGTDQAGWNTDSQAKSAVSGTSHGVFSIGLGGEVDTGHLSDLGKNGSWTANDVSELNDAFTAMSDVIKAKAESLYIFAYCSPKRNGEHVLSLRLIEEDLSLDFGFDATGFQGGCGEDHFADSDQDGFRPWDGDCDDENPSVYPGAEEVCDGLDNNCDEMVDEGLADSTFYADADGDGYGDANSTLEACTTPAGYVANPDDCDDGDASSTHFSVDSDCDGILNVDETGPVFDTAATISPSSGVYTGTALQCSAVVSDQQDGSITPTYAWTIGSVAVGTGATHTVSAATSSVGDSITCTATAIDSDQESAASATSVVVENTAPSISAASISGGDYNTDTLLCTATGSDPDESLNVVYSWSLNSVNIGTGASISLGTTSAMPQDVVYCTASVSDSHGGTASSSVSLTLLNRAPSAPVVSISPSSPTAGVDDLVCNISTASTDADGQSVSYTYDWTTNGASTSYSTDTIPAADVGESETWMCTVTPTDGIDAGSSGSDTVTSASACALTDCDESLDLGGGFGVDFVNIEAGTFMMGSPSGEVGRYSNEDQHSVTLTNDFLVSTTEITQGMFYQLMGYQSYDGFSTSDYNGNGSYGVGDDYPAYYVTWDMAADFSNHLTQQYNSQNGTTIQECYSCSGSGTNNVSCSTAVQPVYSCTGYRLLTEAEWEYAARAGTTAAFWTSNGGGDIPSTWNGNSVVGIATLLTDGFNLTTYGWYYENNSPYGSKEVATLIPNDNGLYDMHGNVHEWTHDTYTEFLGTGAKTDPVEESYVGCVQHNWSTCRVIRNWTWNAGIDHLRSARRKGYPPNYQPGMSMLGFRIGKTNP